MDLWDSIADPTQNILCCDGEAYYFGRVIPAAEAYSLFQQLQADIQWQAEQVTLYGRTHVLKRQVAWYGDQPYRYHYANHTKQALPWTPSLLVLKQRIEQIAHQSFNACLLNFYPSGAEGMGWHSDDEHELQPNAAIASVSLGAERRFCFKHKQLPHKTEVLLHDGSLLLMQGQTQRYWLHSLPISKKIHQSRINLTFRCMR